MNRFGLKRIQCTNKNASAVYCLALVLIMALSAICSQANSAFSSGLFDLVATRPCSGQPVDTFHVGDGVWLGDDCVARTPTLRSELIVEKRRYVGDKAGSCVLLFYTRDVREVWPAFEVQVHTASV